MFTQNIVFFLSFKFVLLNSSLTEPKTYEIKTDKSYIILVYFSRLVYLLGSFTFTEDS
jgi:hypothetical protein